jgi:hypothetical protein
MKTKAFIFILAFSFVAQILTAQKTGILFHTIVLKLPQLAGLSLTTNSNPTKVLNNNHNSLVIQSSNIWLNYHSILNVVNPESSKQVTAQITKGEIDANLSFLISTANDIGKGIGKIGKPVKTPISLNSATAKTIINDIGIAYTGNKIFEGHNITYSFLFNNKNFSTKDQTPSSHFTITYTFLDN